MKDNKLSVVALVIGLVALVSGFFGHKTQAPVSDLGASGSGTTYSYQDKYVNGLFLGNDYVDFTKSGTIPAGQNEAYYTNRSGRRQYISLASIDTNGTASSSFKFYVGTTTSTTINDFTAPYSSLINGFTIATSTVATTTSSIESHLSGSAVIPVADGVTVFVQIQAANGAVCASSGSGICESATSTNRGFNPKWVLHGYYQP